MKDAAAAALGFTAGGSGSVSSVATIRNAPSIQIMHATNLIFMFC